MRTSRTLGPNHHVQEPNSPGKNVEESARKNVRAMRTSKQPIRKLIHAHCMFLTRVLWWWTAACSTANGAWFQKSFPSTLIILILTRYPMDNYRASMEFSDHSFSGKGIEACTPPPVVLLQLSAPPGYPCFQVFQRRQLHSITSASRLLNRSLLYTYIRRTFRELHLLLLRRLLLLLLRCLNPVYIFSCSPRRPAAALSTGYGWM